MSRAFSHALFNIAVCHCDFCRLTRDTFRRERLHADGREAAARDGVMAGVDMPGRIVDDVRPDQRGVE